jgi:hypothetical protein
MRGTPFRVWEPNVPRIPDEYQECSVYLYPSHDFAVRGERMGGTGFLVGVQAATIPKAMHIFAVTNAHVVEAGSCTIRINTHDGKFDVFDFTEQQWFPHPNGDDLAMTVMPGLDVDKYKFKVVGPVNFLTKELAQDANVGPGDDVFITGRFVNLEGKERNIPCLRFGNISQMPHEPLEQRRGGKIVKQESFLVEGRAISGFSGSPVFLMMLRTFTRQGGKLPPQQKDEGRDVIRLLGVVWGYVKNWEPICYQNGNPMLNGIQVEVNTGMMGVVPAWKLQEMLDMPEVKDHMKRAEEAHHKTVGKPSTGLAVASSKPSKKPEAGHRERFNRLLDAAVKRPKSSG